MYGSHVVAIYRTFADAQQALGMLRGAGVGPNNISIVQHSDDLGRSGKQHAFFSWLFSADSPKSERLWYEKNLQEGRAALSVLVPDDEDHLDIAEMLVGAGALYLADEADDSVTADSILDAHREDENTRVRGERETWEDRPASASKAARSSARDPSDVVESAESYRVRSLLISQPMGDGGEMWTEGVLIASSTREEDLEDKHGDGEEVSDVASVEGRRSREDDDLAERAGSPAREMGSGGDGKSGAHGVNRARPLRSN
jgi:hypothetical protein